MDTNFFGALSVTKAALPHLRAQKRGAIVNVSSAGGQLSFSGVSAYSASKSTFRSKSLVEPDEKAIASAAKRYQCADPTSPGANRLAVDRPAHEPERRRSRQARLVSFPHRKGIPPRFLVSQN
jgi:short chain dehydrogenase